MSLNEYTNYYYDGSSIFLRKMTDLLTKRTKYILQDRAQQMKLWPRSLAKLTDNKRYFKKAYMYLTVEMEKNDLIFTYEYGSRICAEILYTENKIFYFILQF